MNDGMVTLCENIALIADEFKDEYMENAMRMIQFVPQQQMASWSCACCKKPQQVKRTAGITTFKVGKELVVIKEIRLLLAEHDEDIRKVIKTVIGAKPNCTVISTGDGKSALDLITANHWDIVFIDIKLPMVSCLDVLRFAIEQQPHAKVYVISESLISEYIGIPKSMAANRIVKPIEAEQILKILNGV